MLHAPKQKEMTDEKETSREGRILKEIRYRRGLTQAALADEICVADLAIRCWKNNDPSSRANLHRLCRWIMQCGKVLRDDRLLHYEATTIWADAARKGFGPRAQ